ncbi:phage antirepressor N-terminal domain-containing protein [Streptomyces avermitilis]|uniref:phage antirepressor N-terminal domain-containing protein n=1 Tax=Streptomyces avermitilis TaxID=33903 RepID=UPI00371D43E5
MSDIALLTPPAPVTVPLSTGALQTVQHEGTPRIVFRPAVEHIGLAWSAQLQKLKNRSWFSRVDIDTAGADGKTYSMVTVDVPTFLMWLATVNETKVAPEARPVLVAYQRETAQAIYGYWTQGVAVRPQAEPVEISGLKGIPTVDFHLTYFGDVKHKAFQDHLYRFGYLRNQLNARADKQGKLTKPGHQHRYPTAMGSRYFQLPAGRYVANGRERGGAVVRPDRVQELVQRLINEGLTANPMVARVPSRLALTSSETVDGHQVEFRRGA